MNTSEVWFSLLIAAFIFPSDDFYVPNSVKEHALQVAQNKPELFGCPIYINQATKEQLMTLPHIGEIRAAEIIRYRTVKPFKHLDDLKNIKGIGKNRLEKLKSRVVMEPTDCLLFE